ncbi:hypothetical protein [Sphingomonas glacialis]|uniref:Uncharacterized protein n=1 Tax=Sphingomonas glacialis TaxID=658225 RepID=A0A502FC57_9SPHN|nr:hypothetical protein [Sphingomonas glacialis]TPG46970.1 hypothetical protein EAH76_22660 [Sphingomonas glacialis]
MSRGPDSATLLQRALERSADAAGCAAVVCVLETTRWASATFVGARHRIALTLRDDPPSMIWLAALGEAELAMRGHLVADIATLSVTRRDGEAIVALETLTVET